MKVKNPSTGEFEEVYVKAIDNLPIGTEVDFNGSLTSIPVGWEQVSPQAQILWTNSSPSSNFAPQEINLSSADYDILEIFYYSSTNQTNSASERIRNKKNTILRWWDASTGKMYERGVNYVNDKKLSIGECSM